MKTLALPPIAAALMMGSVSSQSATLTIGIDLSGSNPLLSQEAFAAQAGQHAAEAIKRLKEGDVVRVRTFGARSDAANLPVHSATIGRRNRPSEVGNAVAAYLRRLPGQAGKGQPSTNILAFLELGSGFGCETNGAVLLITDGIESSSVVSAKALLDGKAVLPAPGPNLRGCALTFYGLGAGWELQQVKNLKVAWSQWAKKAGADFRAISP